VKAVGGSSAILQPPAPPLKTSNNPNTKNHMRTFKLLKNHVRSIRGRPVLLTDDLCLGPYSAGEILPDCTDTAGNIIFRALSGDSVPNDPRIEAEEGGELDTYMLEYLGITDGDLDRADKLAKIARRRKTK